VSEIKIEFNL